MRMADEKETAFLSGGITESEYMEYLYQRQKHYDALIEKRPELANGFHQEIVEILDKEEELARRNARNLALLVP